jgi:hypothetical protein
VVDSSSGNPLPVVEVALPNDDPQHHA